ncbi:MAG: ABC transporter ATP-binding protein [Acutalibacter sp.]
MEPILQIRNLSISFTQYDRGIRRRELPVIRDLSLTIRPGEVVAVVGASGSGKSLLAHAILGLLPYNSHCQGEILYKGESLGEKRLRTLRGKEIALVPQGVTYLDPLMKVGAQLCQGRKDAKTQDAASTALNRYGLGGTEGLYPFQLSGGMARRVLLASAVMGVPQLIIADEPTPGLDVQAAGRVLGHFRELAQEGAAVLFITHDLELALTVAHRVAVFYAGETIEEADVASFHSGCLGHPFTQALWDALPQREFRGLPGAQPYPGEVQQGCPFQEQCPHPRQECGETQVPLRPYGSGVVRCLYPEQGGMT